MSVAADYELGLPGIRFNLRWRVLDGGNAPDDNWSASVGAVAPDDAVSFSLDSLPVPAGETYEVSINAVSSGVPSDWSPPEEIETEVGEIIIDGGGD